MDREDGQIDDDQTETIENRSKDLNSKPVIVEFIMILN